MRLNKISPRTVIVLFILAIMIVHANSLVPTIASQNQAQASSSQLSSTYSGVGAFSGQTYGGGLSGGPVVMDNSHILSMTGGSETVAAMELAIQKYLVPISINLVFLDILWDNNANTSTTQAGGGYQQWVSNWLQASGVFGIKNILFVKQFGYFFASPSWDNDFMNQYPSATTVSATGQAIPLSNCGSGGTKCSGWTIASPYVYRQYEEDLKQLYTWYGNNTNWIGFGEGATGDVNEYAGEQGTQIQTSRPWDNFTMDVFANSVFFKRTVNATGYYTGTNTLSEIWSMFLQDRPDIAGSSGVPLVNPDPLQVYGYSNAGGGSVVIQRFLIPWGTALNGFTLRAFLGESGSPTSRLYETIYPDNASTLNGRPLLNHPIENESAPSQISTTQGWISTTFHSTLVGGDYYWVAFTTPASGSSSSNYYVVTVDGANVFPDIYTEQGFQLSSASRITTGSILWIQSASGQNITVYPEMYQNGANWPSTRNPVYYQATTNSTINMLSFFTSDRAYDPNNITVSFETMSGTVLASGKFSVLSSYGDIGLTYWPVQLSNTVALTAGTEYKIVFGSLPSGDNYDGSGGGGVTQDFIEETTNPPQFGYLGQGTWPVFSVGLMNIEPQGISNFGNIGDTDLQYSPNEVAGGEDGLMFIPQHTETIQSFEVEVVSATSSSNIVNVTLRADNTTCQAAVSGPCDHPTSANAISVLAHGTVSFSTISSGFHSCPGAYGGQCSWANITFTGVSGTTGTSLTAGTKYWLVINASGNQRLGLERLVGAYRNLVYYSQSDYSKDWGVPSDGPTDLSYLLVTSTDTWNYTEYGQVEYSGQAAQPFESYKNLQLKGVWLDTSPGDELENITIQTDSSGSPSGTVLASGEIMYNAPGESQNYASLNFPVNVTAYTKYWIVVKGICPVTSCSASMELYANSFRSDASPIYGNGTFSVETYNSGVWSAPSNIQEIPFILAGSNSTIHVYNTKTLYNEVLKYEDSGSTYSIGNWNAFLQYEEGMMMSNLSNFMQAFSGHQFIWFTSPDMTQNIVSLIPRANFANILYADSAAGGSIGCDPTVCDTPTFFLGDAQEHMMDMLRANDQTNWLPWSSYGNTQDNRGDLSPIDTRTELLMGNPLIAANPVSFNDWEFATNLHGIQNVTQTQYDVAFGNIMSRMQYNGGYYGTSKDAVRVLFIGGSNDGFFPQFLTSAVNVTYDYEDYNLNQFSGNIDQFNVVTVDPSTLTVTGLSTLTNFVKNGGGLVETNFGENPNAQDNLVGLKTGSVSALPTSTLSIVQTNKITSPYSSVSWNAYWLRYGISELSNESENILVRDSNNNPYVVINNYYSGRAVLIETPYDTGDQAGNAINFDGQRFGSPRDSWISLYINALYYAAGKQNMLPIIWENSYSGQQNWSPYLQFSIDGIHGKPVLLWLSSNDSASSQFGINLNATFYNISNQGWLAINMLNMQAVAKGTGSDIQISTTIPAYSWAPIYIMNDSSSSNLQTLYSTLTMVSSSVSGSSESYSFSGPLNSSSWLVLNAPSAINSVSSNLSGSLSSYPSLASLNQTQIGYYCTSVSSSACTSWTSRSQEGYYYDSTNNLLYIHYRGDGSMTLTVSPNGSLSTSTSTTSTASTTSTTTTSSTLTSTASTSTSIASTTSTSTSTTTTTTATSTSSSSFGYISIQASGGPYSVGTAITLSGSTLSSNGSPMPSQLVYIWINGVNQGSVISSSSGIWTFSFTPTSGQTYYASASQNPDGSGVTSQQLQLSVPSTTTSSTSATTTSSTLTSTASTSTSIASTTSTSTSTTTTTAATSTTSASSATTDTVTTTTTSISSSTSSSSTSSTSNNSGSSSTVTTTSSVQSSTSTKVTTTGSSSSTNNTATTSTRTSASQNNTSTATSSTSTIQQPGTTSQPRNFAELFGFIPFLTSSPPTPAGLAIFIYEVGIITAAPFFLKMAASDMTNKRRGASRRWRW